MFRYQEWKLIPQNVHYSGGCVEFGYHSAFLFVYSVCSDYYPIYPPPLASLSPLTSSLILYSLPVVSYLKLAIFPSPIYIYIYILTVLYL